MSITNDAMSLRPPARADGFAGAGFFYSNLRIQENVTTVRYGVETRRGLVIITGAPGTGKTTLLSRAVAEMPAHITCITVTPGTSTFADVLRLIVRGLEDCDGGDSLLDDEAALVQRCQSLLRARLQRSELVALAVDDAHSLPDRTLRNLMHNFLGGSAEAPDGALLQLIFAGGASLRAKLSQAALIPLRRHRPVVCETRPLSTQEVGAYIQHGLRAAERPADLFDERAIKRIALLSQGNPSTIGALSEKALQLGCGSSVDAELIEAAAQALDLRADERANAANLSEPAFSLFDERKGGAEKRQFASSSLAEEPAFFEPRNQARFGWLPHGARLASWVRGLTVLTIVIAAAALIPAQAAVNLLASWRTKVIDLSAREWKLRLEPAPSATERAAADRGAEEPSQSEPLFTIPGPDRPNRSESAPSRLDPPTSPTEQPRSGAIVRGAKPPSKTAAQAETERRPPQQPASPRRDLQLEVAKAIASRAIMGVEVSVVQGTAILDGRVASERQRRAAERAALSVSGVERVRNRIAITFG